MLVRVAFIAVMTLASTPTFAHVTLEQREAAVGGFYKAVLRVPHGCGTSATVRLSVQIPEGVISVKPMAKPGWQIEVKRGAYAKPYSFLHGAKFTEGVTSVTWTGKLLDAYYDEFVLSTFIAAELPSGGMLYFPVVQDCEQGVHRWIEVPTGKPGETLGDPAPGIKLVPQAKGH